MNKGSDYGQSATGDGWLEPGQALRFLCYKKRGDVGVAPPLGLPQSVPCVLKMALLESLWMAK